MAETVDSFVALATRVIDSALASDPVAATFLGDHRHDGELPDLAPEAAADRIRELREQLTALESVSVTGAEAVDREITRTALRAELLDLEVLREAEWNPMLGNPGNGLHALLARAFAPLPERAHSLHSRLRAVPDHLAGARRRLGELSRPHTETALSQLAGTVALLDDGLPSVFAEAPDLLESLMPAVALAREALAAHRDWLGARLETARHVPRLGTEHFAAKLALTLDTEFEPATLLSRAEADLAEVGERIADAATSTAGGRRRDRRTVREVLDRLAADAPTDETILNLCQQALAETTEFVHSRDLVTVYPDPVSVVEMPEIDRGVAVAYCRPVGPLETAPIPTEFAVSPTPAAWTQAQVASFYREYNGHMLHNLTVHEAMPGHALQLAHSNRHHASTPVRAVWWSGSFVEGWAVYAEQLMVDSGYRSDRSAELAAAVRMQQLKMQLRMIINTILDVRYHCADLDEHSAMELMMRRGFQEEGEALGKWRRVQLTATQLCTYYVGYREVSELVDSLARAQPRLTRRQLHDTMLGAGSPPVRHLRTLLDLR
jgi:uncharacterized protein (DUF885 family)